MYSHSVVIRYRHIIIYTIFLLQIKIFTKITLRCYYFVVLSIINALSPPESY